MHRLPEAIAETVALFAPLGAERVALLSSIGRRLARDVVARRSLPPFDASAMDGFAVRAADVGAATREIPVALEVTFDAPAGRPSDRVVGVGEAARVLTGSAMPRGADAVVIQEDTAREGSRLLVRAAVRVGANIRAQGSDLLLGTTYLTRGSRIDPGGIALLASEDVAAPEVVRRPIVAILPTGDELRGIGEPESHGTIVDSNAPMLASLVEREGGIARILPIVGDDRAAIAKAMAANLDADLVLTTGGVSVGDHDYVPEAIESIGATIHVRKVRMKPGKPVTVASLGRIPIIGLPGNPASAMVGFELFVAPGLRRMQGDEFPFPEGEDAMLAHALRRSTGRPELCRGEWVFRDGRRFIDVSRTQGSGSLRALSGCDALALLAADTASLPEGASVFVVPFGGQGRRAMTAFAERPELDSDRHG